MLQTYLFCYKHICFVTNIFVFLQTYSFCLQTYLFCCKRIWFVANIFVLLQTYLFYWKHICIIANIVLFSCKHICFVVNIFVLFLTYLSCCRHVCFVANTFILLQQWHREILMRLVSFLKKYQRGKLFSSCEIIQNYLIL